MTRRFMSLRRLRRDENGATIVELGFAAPIFFMILIGIFDIGYGMYCRSVLVGAVNEAARSSALQSGIGRSGEIDTKVTDTVKKVMPSAILTFNRKNYESFSSVGRPEDYNDANNNTKYDANECFTDINNNQSWDADVGSNGQGGADDVVVYSVTLRYQDIFPLWRFIGLSDYRQTQAKTLLRNQPYASQSVRVPIQVCPAT